MIKQNSNEMSIEELTWKRYTFGSTHSLNVWLNEAHHTLLNDAFYSPVHLMNGWDLKYILSFGWQETTLYDLPYILSK